MLDSLILQVIGNITGDDGGQSIAVTTWNLLDTIMVIFIGVSTWAIFWATKLRNALKNSKNENAQKLVNVLENYVLPIFEQGKQVVESTKNQEVKIKQGLEVFYALFPNSEEYFRSNPKIEIQLKNLDADIKKANIGSEEYNAKLKQFVEIIESIKSQIPATK